MTKEKIIAYCAQAAHEVNRVFCEAHGDNSQLPWEEAPEWQIISAIRGVSVALDGATPEQQHEAWSKDKIKEGWKYGPVKDPFKKEHPCLVPYSELPLMQQLKDSLYISVVNAMYQSLSQDD